MDHSGNKEEVRLNYPTALAALPGYLYDKNTGQCFPRDDGKVFNICECLDSYRVEHYSMGKLENLIKISGNVRPTWINDLEAEAPVDAILIKGTKILENMADNFTKHDLHHSVISTLYKGHVDMLLTFSREVHVSLVNKLMKYINAVVNESSGDSFPVMILSFSKLTFIYDKFYTNSDDSSKTDTSKHAVDEYCRILKSCNISTIPITCYIAEPSSSNVTGIHDRNLPQYVSDKTPMVSVDGNSLNGNACSGQDVNKQLAKKGRGRGRVLLSNKSMNISMEPKSIEISSSNRSGRSFVSNNQSSSELKYHTTKKLKSERCDMITEEVDKLIKEEIDHSQISKLKVDVDKIYLVDNMSSFDGQSNDTKIHVDVEKNVDAECKINLNRNLDDKLKSKEKLSQECRNSPSSTISTVKDKTFPDEKIQKKVGQIQSEERNSPPPMSHYSLRSTSKVQQRKLNEVENVSCPVKPSETSTVSQQCQHENKQINFNFLNPIKTIPDPCGIERKYYGQINESLPEKVILLLGASGCGKSTLLNFIANYFEGKETADEELVHVVTMEAPTSLITAYTFCTAEDETPITVVDTPGLNDSCGAEIRDHVQSLKIFIANASSKGFEIHAIGFVAQAHLVRLTSSERLVMDYVSTMFGERVSDHLITFVTFADSQNTPPIIEAMKNYGVNFKQFFKFNNSALSNRNSDEVDDLTRVYWKICRKQWKKCLRIVKDLPCLSVKAMKAVQSEVYAATVIESAEKSLNAEMFTFLKQCHKENCISKEMEEVCKQIWQLAAVLQKLKSEKGSSSCSVELVLLNCAVEVCKTLSLSPEEMVSYLCLTPSGRLVVAGSEVVLTMEPIYKISKTLHARPESLAKYEWAYCHGCESDHKLVRIKNKKSLRKYITDILWDQSESIICLKCQTCSCAADLHGVSTVKSPISKQEILKHTRKRLQEVLRSYSLPGYPVNEEIYLKFLAQRLGPHYAEFVLDIFNVEGKM